MQTVIPVKVDTEKYSTNTAITECQVVWCDILFVTIVNGSYKYLQVEQYKNVVFYGPVGASKTFLAKKLATCVKVKTTV